MSSEKQQGVVKFFNEMKGYGFITPNSGGEDIFVHVTALKRSGIDKLNEGDVVQFDAEPSERKAGKSCAINLAVVG